MDRFEGWTLNFRLGTAARTRGRTYALESRVRWNHVEARAAEAEVRGTRRYTVRVSFDAGALHVERASCTCPAHESWGPCKHVAATLLELKEAVRRKGLTVGGASAPRPVPLPTPSANVSAPPTRHPSDRSEPSGCRDAWSDELSRLFAPAGPNDEAQSEAPFTPTALPADFCIVLDLSQIDVESGQLHAVSRIRFMRRSMKRIPKAGRQTARSIFEPAIPVTRDVIDWIPYVVPLLNLDSVADPALAVLLRDLFLRCHKSQAKPAAPWKFAIPRKAHGFAYTGAEFKALFPRLVASGHCVIADTTAQLDPATEGLPLRTSNFEVEPVVRFEQVTAEASPGGGPTARVALELRRKDTDAAIPFLQVASRESEMLALLGYVKQGCEIAPLPAQFRSAERLKDLRRILGTALSIDEVRSLQQRLAFDLQLPSNPPHVRAEFAPELLLPVELGKPTPRFILNPGRSQNGVSPARLYFDYGNIAVSPVDSLEILQDLVDSKVVRLVRRNMEVERELQSSLCDVLDPPDEEDPSSYGFPLARLRELIEALDARGVAFELDGRRFVPKVSSDIVIREKRDWFEVTGSVSFGAPFEGNAGPVPSESGYDRNLTLPEGLDVVPLDRILRAIVEGHQIIEVGEGRVALLPADLEKALRPLLRRNASGTRSLSTDTLAADQLAFLMPGFESITGTVSFEGRAATLREELRNLRQFRPERPPAAFRGKLRPYQAEGLGWLGTMARIGLGVCLADDMGLGKTVQIIAHLSTLRAKGSLRCLLVAPRSLLENWKRECARFFPRLCVVDISQPGCDLATCLRGDGELFLTTYALATRDHAELARTRFDVVILDEAQNIKNPDTKAARATRSLKATHRIALTGTPIENGLRDLASLMRFLNPGLLELDSPLRALAVDARSTAEVPDLDGLTRCLKPFLLRRTKAQVLDDLPTRTETVVRCPMPHAQQALYRRAAEEFRLALAASSREKGGIRRIKIEVVHALLRLRQIACHPRLVHQGSRAGSGKFDYLLERLETLLVEKRKVLVFSQFTSLLALLARELEARKWGYAMLDGSTRDRQGVIDAFARSKETLLFLLSLKAGGVGLNLTMADTVFVLDPWWNPAAEAQAIDRAHRIGQTRAVNAYRLVAEGTVEEKILLLQSEKKELADAILSGSTSTLSSLSPEDLAFLLETP